jgi:hypothetical protein
VKRQDGKKWKNYPRITEPFLSVSKMPTVAEAVTAAKPVNVLERGITLPGHSHVSLVVTTLCRLQLRTAQLASYLVTSVLTSSRTALTDNREAADVAVVLQGAAKPSAMSLFTQCLAKQVTLAHCSCYDNILSGLTTQTYPPMPMILMLRLLGFLLIFTCGLYHEYRFEF